MKISQQFLWRIFNRDAELAVKSSNAALFYLEQEKKRRRWTPTITIGPRSLVTKNLITKICGAKNYPPLPLLEDNKTLRNLTEVRAKSPLFKVAAGALAEKFYELKREIKEAIAKEKSKIPPDHILYRIESTTEILPEEKEPAEILDTKELSDKL